MFFNENLYLEGADEVTATPMTDDEIAEACESAQGKGESFTEGAQFYTTYLEGMSILDEQYYNLREKVMQVEHVAAMKNVHGLVSESETLISEGVDGFVDGVKKIFTKMKNLVINLFNKFVDFIMGFTTRKQLEKWDVDKAIKQFVDKYGKGKVKVKVLDRKQDSLSELVGVAQKLYAHADNFSKTWVGYYKKAAKDAITDNSSRPDKFIDRVRALNDVGSEFLLGLTNNDETNTYSLKKEVAIESVVKDALRVVLTYKKILNQIKMIKAQAIKSLDDGIKTINEFKNPSEKQKKVQAQVIAEIRFDKSMITKCFSKLTSFATTWYRESWAIVHRVKGRGVAQDVKSNFEEGVSVASFFEM